MQKPITAYVPLLPTLILLITLSAACKPWVELSPQGATVQVKPANAVDQCKSIGNISAKSLASISIYKRNPAKLQEETTILARNEAARMGANTIVRENDLNNGEQSFSAYYCVY